ALLAQPPALFGVPRRRARLEAARLRLRRTALVLALSSGAAAIARRGSARAAALLGRGADVLSRAPGVLRHPHLRDDGRRCRRMAARDAGEVRRPVRTGAGGEAQRLVPAPGPPGP